MKHLLTWRTAFFLLLFAVLVNYTYSTYQNGYWSEETTYVAHQAAKYQGGEYIYAPNQPEVIRLHFLTAGGDHIWIEDGKISHDLKARTSTHSYVYLAYSKTTQYARNGNVLRKSYDVQNWEPLPYKLHAGVSW